MVQLQAVALPFFPHHPLLGTSSPSTGFTGSNHGAMESIAVNSTTAVTWCRQMTSKRTQTPGWVCMSVCLHACMYVFMHVCSMYERMYVPICTYVCMSVYTYQTIASQQATKNGMLTLPSEMKETYYIISYIKYIYIYILTYHISYIIWTFALQTHKLSWFCFSHQTFCIQGTHLLPSMHELNRWPDKTHRVTNRRMSFLFLPFTP